jgi:hypothetical protein
VLQYVCHMPEAPAVWLPRRIVRVAYQGKPLASRWSHVDKWRPLRRYAVTFAEMLVEHVRELFPVTRPSEPKRGGADVLAGEGGTPLA